MAMKAMNCPGHMLVFASEMRSYRDLPLRFHEQTPLHRNEASGVLSGLTRVRQFSQDDAHCFVMEEQIGEEVERLLRLVQRVYGDFGLEYSAKLSTRPDRVPRRDRDLGSRRGRAARRALEAAGQAYTINEGDGAFYGPKIDFEVTDAIGRKWQCATIQLDYQHAGALRPEVHRRRQRRAPAGGDPPRDLRQLRAVHRAADRALRRRVPAVAGAGAGRGAADRGPASRRTPARGARPLEAAGLRVELDERQEKIGYKIREAQLQKMPYMLVIGDREAAEGTVVRARARRAGTRAPAVEAFVDGRASRERTRARAARQR